MANTKQAKKRVRQAEKRRCQNASRRSEVRTSVKKVIAAIVAKDSSEAREVFKNAVSVIDRATQKHIIHKNKASRLKSRLHKRIKTLDLENTAE